MCDTVSATEAATKGGESFDEALYEVFDFEMTYKIEGDNNYFYETRTPIAKLQCHHGDGNWEDVPEVKEGEEAVYVPDGSYLRVVPNA